MGSECQIRALPRLICSYRWRPARVPRTHAETVSRQNQGLIGLLDGFILPNADQLQGEERTRLDAAVAAKEIEVVDSKLLTALLNALVGEAALYARRTGRDSTSVLRGTLDAVFASLKPRPD